MPQIRRRRTTREVDDEPESSEEEQARGPQRRRTGDATQFSPVANNAEEDAGYGSDSAANQSGTQPLARKLVRYALACEYSRVAIKRADIGAKVLPQNSGRVFKQVFEMAQGMLRETFGMEMAELPRAEKVDLVARRKAAQTQPKANASTGSWVLTSILPPKYRTPAIIPPPSAPTPEQEADYVAIYTFIVTLIYLHGGRLPEDKLTRQMRRMNADRNSPIGSTDELYKRMVKDGYIVKHVDRAAPGEEANVDWMVGPRGKVEVGEEGAGGLVRAVYGGSVDDLESRLDRSLGISGRMASAEESRRKNAEANETNATQTQTQTQARRKSGRRATQRRGESSEEEEEESEEDD